MWKSDGVDEGEMRGQGEDGKMSGGRTRGETDRASRGGGGGGGGREREGAVGRRQQGKRNDGE